MRLEVSSRNGKPVFVGIARTKDVSAYLRGTAHATVTDFHSDPFRAVYRAEPGAARPRRGARLQAHLGRLGPRHGHADASPGTSSTATGRSWS